MTSPAGIRFYDIGGDLPARAADLWATIGDAEMEMARDFWRRYRQSEEVTAEISDDKVEEYAAKIVPYLRQKYLHLTKPEWVATARAYVERALGAEITLVDPAVGRRRRKPKPRSTRFAPRSPKATSGFASPAP